MDRILFLDVDGVLNNPGCYHLATMDNGNNFILQTLLDRLAGVCKKHDLKIVISSSWRLYDKYRLTLISRLKEVGLEVVSMTRDSGGAPRHAEIQEWIDIYRPMVFVIVDDMEFASNCDLDPFFVNVDGSRGLTDEDVTKIEEIVLKQNTTV